MTEDRRQRGKRAHERGLDAEAAAVRALSAAGCEILEQRCRTPFGEIDIVARDGGTLVFVEVKARRSLRAAGEALTARQWARLESAALHYADLYRTATNLSDAAARTGSPDLRFDVILVDADGRTQRIENARSFDEW